MDPKPIYTPIFTHHIRSSLLCTPVYSCFRDISGPDYYVPLYIVVYGGAYVISNQDPRCTQKPIYIPIFTHHIRSSLLCTPVYSCFRDMSGPDYYVPPYIVIYGGAYVISNQDPRCTPKPIYIPIFTHHIRSSLLCTLVNSCFREMPTIRHIGFPYFHTINSIKDC